jgi:hypothetical protein
MLMDTPVIPVNQLALRILPEQMPEFPFIHKPVPNGAGNAASSIAYGMPLMLVLTLIFAVIASVHNTGGRGGYSRSTP